MCTCERGHVCVFMCVLAHVCVCVRVGGCGKCTFNKTCVTGLLDFGGNPWIWGNLSPNQRN